VNFVNQSFYLSVRNAQSTTKNVFKNVPM